MRSDRQAGYGEFAIVGAFCWTAAVTLLAAAVVPHSAHGARLVVAALAVGAYCALAGGRVAAACAAGFGCLFYEGFLPLRVRAFRPARRRSGGPRTPTHTMLRRTFRG